ncbi:MULTISPECIES: leucine-rich repeat domain-containing protein [unclassified Chryseobacterium]|uniref:leucine-rich repeat domain-containing protein n=1 Tax=unclassified Chryseobacterium TaxID=2593645 RepID=UPI00301B1CCD
MSTENTDNQINRSTVLDEETQKIEEILGIKPEDYLKYNLLQYLHLKDVDIEDFSKFLPYLVKVTKVKLTNCTIANFSELLKIESCSSFTLDNVTFRNNECNVTTGFPYEIRFSNMTFDAGCFNSFHISSSGKGYKHLFITNCHIDNIQEISTIKGLYSLHLDNITFTCNPSKVKEKSIYMIHIFNSKFEDISFIPFKKSVTDIEFKNCRIGSFNGISEFEKLEEIEMTTDTVVENKEELENPFNKEITCHFSKAEKPFRLKNAVSLRNYINELSFTYFKVKKIKDLENFEMVKTLSFDKSEFYVDAFLPIANQIQKVKMRDSEIKKHNYFRSFVNLKSFESLCFSRESKEIKNFSKLLLLKDQLTSLDFYEDEEMDKKAPDYHIGQFTSLETLKLGYEISAKTGKSIMQLKKLKKLKISTVKTKQTFDLGHLKKLEFLIFNSRTKFIGFENLKRLKSLKIINDKKFDLRTLPKIESLKRLNLYGNHSKMKGFSRFPNLEFLSLQGAGKVNLKPLKKLKVLDLYNSNIKDFSSFATMPFLEKLDLSRIQNNIDLKEMYKFPNLKWLGFLENEELDDISGLEPLKKLERLDLYKTNVTDVKVLNTLPNLEEVNLAVKNYKLDLKAQLDRPEIAAYYALPSVMFFIWKEDEFGI